MEIEVHELTAEGTTPQETVVSGDDETIHVVEVSQGVLGESAYEIAVRYGYEGSEEEWNSAVNANRVLSEQARDAAIQAKNDTQQLADQALADIGTLRIQALNDILTDKNGAIQEITNERAAALSAINQAHATALSEISNAQTAGIQAVVDARDAAVNVINSLIQDAESARDIAVAAKDTAVDAANTATTQAGIATTQAGIATDAAGTATTQAGIATDAAGTATTQAGIATDATGIATDAAQNAATSATNAAGSAQAAATDAGTATTQAGIATDAAATATDAASTATTQASNASTSANTASTKAAEAASSAASALNDRLLAEDSAQSALDSLTTTLAAQSDVQSNTDIVTQLVDDADAARTDALNYRDDAAVYANQASVSAGAAEGSSQTADTHKQAAQQSATTAAQQASIAVNAAESAGSDAASALAHKNASESAANSANTSATNSANSAAAAEASNTSALAHKNAAESSAAQAMGYRDTADQHRIDAEAAKDAAEGFASSASNSAATATTEANRSKDEADRAAGYADTIAGGMSFLGLWDASNNTLPTPPTVGSAQWKISSAGILNGHPVNEGDTLIYSANDETFLFLDTRDQVTSVNGRLGAVTGLAELSEISPVGLSGDYNDLTNRPSLAIANWNTAYGWGNHASAGYATGDNFSTTGDYAGLRARSTTKGDVGLAGIPDANGVVTDYLRGDGTWGALPASATRSTISLANITNSTSTSQGFITGQRMHEALTSYTDSFSSAGYNKANWDAAYSWGNHAVEGYLKAVSWDDVSSKPATATRWPTWSEVSGKPALAPATHSHGYADLPFAASDVTNWNTAFSERGSQIAGTGLSWSTGNLHVSYGSTGDTACVGNDSRLSNSREWTASTVSQAEAEAGMGTTRRAWTSQRVRQNVAAYTSPFNPEGSYTGLRAQATTKDDVGLSGIPDTNGNTLQWLRGDGTWVAPPNTNTVTSVRANNTGTYRTGNINLVGGTNVTVTEGANGVFTFSAVDTNTTYSAGAGLTLSGTQFTLPVSVSGSGTYVQSVAQTATGLQVTLGTPPNTTYSEISTAEIDAGTASTARAISARRIKYITDQLAPVSHSHTYADLPFSATNVNNWNTAFGWGNHASAGYAVSGTGTSQVRTNSQLDSRYSQTGHTHTPAQVGLTTDSGDLTWENIRNNIGFSSTGSPLIDPDALDMPTGYYIANNMAGAFGTNARFNILHLQRVATGGVTQLVMQQTNFAGGGGGTPRYPLQLRYRNSETEFLHVGFVGTFGSRGEALRSFYEGTETPTGTDRLNFNGALHATSFSGESLSQSSLRYKTVERTVSLSESMEKVKALGSNGVSVGTYNETPDGDKHRWLIAEEVYKHLPEAVGLDDQGRPDSLKLAGLIPDLYAALAGALQRIEQLEAEVAALKEV